MAIDIFIMPITRYKMGTFATSLERSFGGIVHFLSAKSITARFKAAREVNAIRRAVTAANGGIPK